MFHKIFLYWWSDISKSVTFRFEKETERRQEDKGEEDKKTKVLNSENIFGRIQQERSFPVQFAWGVQAVISSSISFVTVESIRSVVVLDIE